MRQQAFFLGNILFLIVVMTSGCATGSADSAATLGAATPQDLSKKVFYYRQQATELSAMAQRLELEAQWYARQGGQDSEQAKRSRALAKEMRSAAEEADQLAREYRSQLPHNQVY